MKTTCGWAGKILKVDLSERKITALPSSDYYERFIGGIGIGQKFYWDASKPGLTSFDPESPLMFMTGPLTGTSSASASRYSVVSISPQTGIWGQANSGGR